LDRIRTTVNQGWPLDSDRLKGTIDGIGTMELKVAAKA